MASEEAIITRRVAADARISTAVATIAERDGITVPTMPQLPREVDPAFRAMVEREVLADTLELIAAGPTTDSDEGAESSEGEIEDLTVTVGDTTYAVDRLDDFTRPELNDLAATLGIESPDKLQNKAAVIAAIVATATPSDEDQESGEDAEP